MLIKHQQIENHLLRTIAMNTSLQRSRIRHIQNTYMYDAPTLHYLFKKSYNLLRRFISLGHILHYLL